MPLYAEEVLVVKADVDEKRQRIAELEMQACLAPCCTCASTCSAQDTLPVPCSTSIAFPGRLMTVVGMTLGC